MKPIEERVRSVLRQDGIDCHTVYAMPDPDAKKILLAFGANKNRRLTTSRIERILNSSGLGRFNVPREFQRLSAAFLHLEVTLGADTPVPDDNAR